MAILFVATPVFNLACFAAVGLLSASLAAEHCVLSTNAKSFWFPNLAVVQDCTTLVVTNAHSLAGSTVVRGIAVVYFLVTSGTLEIWIQMFFQLVQLRFDRKTSFDFGAQLNKIAVDVFTMTN